MHVLQKYAFQLLADRKHEGGQGLQEAGQRIRPLKSCVEQGNARR
jgi:hypothetical protein